MSQAATLPPDAISSPAPRDEPLYEIVNGMKVEKPPIGNFQALVGSVLGQLLGAHVRTNRLGRVVSEMLFKINEAGDPQRRPDVAYVSFQRWPRERKINSDNGLDAVPKLFVEVISPSNTASEVLGKIREYFEAGARRVWVVYPVDRLV